MLERAPTPLPKNLVPPKKRRSSEKRAPTASERAWVHEKFLQIRHTTRQLFEPLTEEDAILSVTEDTSPPKWHLAHTTWFFERFILKRWSKGYREFNPGFDFLFNSYYETVGAFLPKKKRCFISRPTTQEVFQYRKHVDDRIVALIHEIPLKDFGPLKTVLEIGINHEQQHQELLLMDVKRNFYENPIRPAYVRDPLVSKFTDPLTDANSTLISFQKIQSRPRSNWQSYEGGLALIGAKADDEFSYDNEKGQHHVWLQPFELRSGLVTNGEYLEFIEAGAYKNPRFWLSDGWNLVQELKWNAPLYWDKDGSGWRIMTLYGMKDLDLDEPVSHISYYEAQAFARWKNCRLPTEFEWEMAARQEKAPGHFLDQDYYHPSRAVTLFESFASGAFSQTKGKIQNLHGTLWEWTQSSHHPYPGYSPLDHGLSEYNEKFMCNQMVLRGGSCVTPKDHYRLTYRNFYYPQMRWQFSGLRLARDANP